MYALTAFPYTAPAFLPTSWDFLSSIWLLEESTYDSLGIDVKVFGVGYKRHVYLSGEYMYMCVLLFVNVGRKDVKRLMERMKKSSASSLWQRPPVNTRYNNRRAKRIQSHFNTSTITGQVSHSGQYILARYNFYYFRGDSLVSMRPSTLTAPEYASPPGDGFSCRGAVPWGIVCSSSGVGTVGDPIDEKDGGLGDDADLRSTSILAATPAGAPVVVESESSPESIVESPSSSSSLTDPLLASDLRAS
jgi:hypothetical protein